MSRRALWIVPIVAVVVAAAWLAKSTSSPEAPRAPSPSPSPSPSYQTSSTSTSTSTSTTTSASTTRDVARPKKGVHKIDPCEPPPRIELPAGFSSTQADGITVAWDPAVTLEATPLAYTTAGLLAQFAIVSGTTPRGELTVIVYASLDDLHAKAGAPAWAAGVYDGAVRVPALARSDLGVDIHTLRHELVHAQLHVAIGCTSIWLDEGLAQWFENMPPSVWQQLLRHYEMLEPRALQASTLEEIHAERPEQVYAASLAMVIYALDRGDTISDLVHDHRGPPLELWQRRYPEATSDDVRAAFERRIAR